MLKIKPKYDKKNILTWNVLVEDINRKEIVSHNIFDHVGFVEDLVKDYNRLKRDKTLEDFEAAFIERIKSNLMYYYWSKAEWEVVVTSWPVYISSDNVPKLNKRIEDNEKRWGLQHFNINISPTVDEKIDVYDQIMLNWDIFIEYVLNHTKELMPQLNILLK